MQVSSNDKQLDLSFSRNDKMSTVQYESALNSPKRPSRLSYD